LALDVKGKEPEVQEVVFDASGYEVTTCQGCEVEEEIVEVPDPEIYLLEATQYGLIRLKFTQDMVIPTNLLDPSTFFTVEMVQIEGETETV
jgi:hypothetical protein